MIDLWPENIENKRVKSPVAILREQASFLGKKTNNLVQAEIIDSSSSDYFVYHFDIVAPALNNYRYRLLTLFHDIALYPVEVGVEEGILGEVSGKVQFHHDERGDVYLLANSEDEFLKVLKVVFGSGKSIRVITSLLSQSDPNWKPKDYIPF